MMSKRHIASILGEIAFYLRLKGGNPYRSAAYERAGRALLLAPDEGDELLEGNRLTEIPYVGPGTAAVIRELLLTGRSSLYERVKGSYPASLVELGEVPGLKPKQILRLYEEAGIRSVAELQTACRSNHLLALRGIGPKGQARIERALGEFRRGQGYRLYASVVDEAAMMEKKLSALRGVTHVTAAGALRRKMEAINGFHFVISCADGRNEASFLERLRRIPNVSDAVMNDPREVRAVSPTGLPVRMSLAESSDHDYQLLLATGSDEHLEQLLQRFAERGLDTWEAIHRRVKGLREPAIYRAAGLPWVPPPLREGRGEIEFTEPEMQRLIEPTQIQGFFHLHTNYSDGSGTVEDMVVAARDRGYRYLGISDHSQSAFYANGLKEPQIREQWREIDAVQAKYPEIHIFKGIEADILPDGSMDYGDELLSQFDFVIASVHSRFNLPEAEQTRRVCRALANPHVTMLGHPTGRLLLSRPGYRLNMHEVLETARTYGKAVEINGSRHRLDLDWRHIRSVKGQGLRFSLNPDAHAVDELDNIALAVNVAQKGGLSANDILNTRSLSAMKAILHPASSPSRAAEADCA
jgi:DNA polymerase (family X)